MKISCFLAPQCIENTIWKKHSKKKGGDLWKENLVTIRQWGWDECDHTLQNSFTSLGHGEELALPRDVYSEHWVKLTPFKLSIRANVIGQDDGTTMPSLICKDVLYLFSKTRFWDNGRQNNLLFTESGFQKCF